MIFQKYSLIFFFSENRIWQSFLNVFLKNWYLKLSVCLSLGQFSRWQISDIFFIFPRKQDLQFHTNCLQWRKFAWNVKYCFLGKIRKIFQYVVYWKFLPRELSVKNLTCFSSSDFAQRMLKLTLTVHKGQNVAYCEKMPLYLFQLDNFFFFWLHENMYKSICLCDEVSQMRWNGK